LSSQIQKLEDEVGGILFHRAHAGTDLSELGEAFLPHAEAIMAQVRGAEEFSALSRTTLQREVRLGAIPTIAPYLLPQLVIYLKKRHPEAEFKIFENTTETQLKALENREIDFVLLSPPTRLDDRLSAIDVMNDELLITLPKGHPLSSEGALSLADLQNDSLILLEDGHCLSEQSRVFCKASGLDTDVTVRSAQIETLIAMVEQGMGFTLTPELAVPTQQQRELSFHPVSPEPISRKIQLVWNTQTNSSNTHNILMESLKKWKLEEVTR